MTLGPPSGGAHFDEVRSEGDFIVTPLRQRMMEDLQIRNYAPTLSGPTFVALPTSPSTLVRHLTNSAQSRFGSINCS